MANDISFLISAQADVDSAKAETQAALGDIQDAGQQASTGMDDLAESSQHADEGMNQAAEGGSTLASSMGAVSDLVSPLSSELGELTDKMGEMAKSAGEALGEGGLGALEGVGTAGAAALTGLAMAGGNTVTQLTQIAATTGLTIEEADKLSLAFEDAGSSSQVLIRAGAMIDSAMGQAATAMEKGGTLSGKAAILVDQLGVSLTDGATSGEVFTSVLDKLAAMYQNADTRQQALNISTQLFGARMAGQIVPVIENYAQLQGTAAEQSAKLGNGLDDVAQKSIAWHTALTNLEVDFESLSLKVLPGVTFVVDQISKSTDGWTEAINLVDHGISSLGDTLGISKEKTVDYQDHLKELGEKEMPDVAEATTNMKDRTVEHQAALDAVNQGIVSLTQEMGAQHTATVTVQNSTKDATTELKSQKTALDDSKLSLADHKLALDQSKLGLTEQGQALDMSIKNLENQKASLANSAAEITNHTTKTKENATAIAVHNQAVTDSKLALDREIQSLQVKKQELDRQKTAIDDSRASIGLQNQALDNATKSLTVQGQTLKETTTTYTTTTGNAKAFNDALGAERDVLEMVRDHLQTSDSSLTDWTQVAKDAAAGAKGFNDELTALTSSLDKYKSLPTPQLLELKAAQADVNAVIADYKVKLDAAGISSDDHLKSLEAEKKVIDDQVSSLQAHRDKVIADTQAVDAAKMSADGLAKSEVQLAGDLEASTARMTASMASLYQGLELAQNLAQSIFSPGNGPLYGPAPPPESHALGGPVYAGHPYTVGEFGDETFVPSSNGSIVPHGGGGGDTHIHVYGSILAEKDILRIVRDARSGGGFYGTMN